MSPTSLDVSRGATALAVLLLAACAGTPAADRIVYRVDEAPAPTLMPTDPFRSTSPPSPADDIPESRRIKWVKENAPPPRRPPPQSVTEPMRVRVVETVRAPYREAIWWPPVLLSLGWWYGHRHHHHHHGFDWGVGWQAPLW